jgi:predicted O-linked N-acetylglucosamine transferase (SPINDLY family)
MGAGYIDYKLADRFVIPASERQAYAERIAYLPDMYQGNDAKRPATQAAPDRATLGLPPEGFVFCSFNSSYKILPGVFDVWMRLLREVRGSVLWLVGGDPVLEANLRREASLREVDPGRLVFAPKLAYADHLARYGAADLFLDTLPFNAGTTASDALWAGLPVLTCSGRSFAGRMAGSLLHAIGLPELVTDSLDDYAKLALALANDRTRLDAIRGKLASHRASFPLFDTARFCRHVEAAYVTMTERQRRGDPPVDFDVAPLQ